MEPSKNKNNFIKIYTGLSSIAIIILFVLVLAKKEDKYIDLLRTRGIVIVDKNDNERILIGAPVPYASNRIRTDTIRAKDAWGFIHPDYMEFYKKYDHSANGILILDENGHDRIAIGNNAPDPNIGRRIAPLSGIALNDENGFERTGYGILKVNGIDRVTLGMDTNKGTEGMVLTVDDDGTTGVSIRGQKHNIFLGKADSLNWFSRNEYPFNGLLIQHTDSSKYNFNTFKKDVIHKK